PRPPLSPYTTLFRSDPPSSSLPPLVALEAALPQGHERQHQLLLRMRRAAFLDGINVARRDVQLELASRAGLDMPRFLEQLDDPRSEEHTSELQSPYD